MEQTHADRDESGVELTSQVPSSSWKTTTLQKVCLGSPQNGAFIKKAKFGSGILYVNVYDIYQNPILAAGNVERVEWDDAAKKRYLLSNGDLLFVRSSLKREGVGQCCLVTNLNEPTIFDCHLIRVSPDSTIVVPLYLAYFFLAESQRRDLISRATTTTMTTLNQNTLMQTRVVLPPLAEQRAIVQVLRAVQESLASRRRELALERERKAALMEHLFAHGTSKAETATTDVGQLPSNWGLKPLGEVADVVYGVQAAVAHLTEPSSGIPILTNVNITNRGALDLTTLRYFRLPASLRTRALLATGDVLFNWRSGSQNHIGKTAIFEEDGEFTFSSFILRFRPTDVLFNRFLFYFLQVIKARGYFTQNRQQSSVNSVFNASVAATIPVALPELTEQREIAECLHSCDKKIRAVEAEVRSTEELLSALLEELISGRLGVSKVIDGGTVS